MVHCLMLDLISAYENYLTKVKQASANTVFSYLRDVRQFADWLQEHEGTNVVDATQLHISGYLSHLEQEGRSGSTVSRSLASLKNSAIAAYDLGCGLKPTSMESPGSE